jgi:hypothetical protein
MTHRNPSSAFGHLLPSHEGRRPHWRHFLGETARVRWLDGRPATANELLKGDSIRVDGDLEKNVIHAERVTILQRDQHR